jgi:bla regulator protein BlaR1
MRLCTPIVCALVFVTPLSAQRDDSKPARFDVASIKEIATPDDSRRLPCGLPGVERSGNRIRIPLTQLCGLIRVAYDVGEYQVTGIPEKQGVGATNFFEVEALVENVTAPGMEAIRLMLRTLLAERFRLQVRRQPVEMPVFVVSPAEGGLKTTACADPKATSSYVPGRIVSCAPPLSMARFAQFLSRETGRMVLDKTGRETMTFELHWLPDTAPPQPDSPPSLFTAIREQLGLTLEAERAPVDAVVVAHAERPSPN